MEIRYFFKNFYTTIRLKDFGTVQQIKQRTRHELYGYYYPNLKSLQINEPPKTIHLYFEDKQYGYTLSK